MMAAVIAIAIAYAALGTLLLSLNIASRWPWWVKAGAICITGFFYVGAYAATEDLLGWPSRGALPGRFQVLATKVVEPEHRTGSGGAIYLWVDELDAANLPSGVPRSFRVPYSLTLAEKVRHTQEEIAAGRRQAGMIADVETGTGQDADPAANDRAKGNAAAGGDVAGAARIDVDSFLLQTQAVRFNDMPAPLLPPKE
jgi:hypothetical protein